MTSAALRADVFRAIADPTRRGLLDLLLESELSVSELARPFHMSQPAISQHLRILREAGLVRGRPAGRQRLYRIEPRQLQEVYDWAAHYRQSWDFTGSSLDRHP
jgi:DNA-binding transcriptional ArsR family regulator